MHERARFAGILASVAIVYILAGVVGLSFHDLHPAVTPIWPPAGIAVASLLVLGPRTWPAIALGAFITNLIALSGDVRLAAPIAVGNTLEAAVATALATRVAHGRLAFERGPDVFRFTFIAALGAALISTGVGMLSIGLANQIPAGGGVRLGITWWLGNATGMALYTPFCVLLATHHDAPHAGWKELAALAAAVVLVVYAAVALPADLQRDIPLAILIMPLMLWSAFRIGMLETSALAVIMSGVAVYRSREHLGPFEFDEGASALILVQSLVAVVSLLMLAVAAESGVRRRVESKLRLLNETLERRVHDRTAEITRIRDRLIEAQAVAQIGSWEWDLATNAWWSDGFSRLFGVLTVPSSYDAYLALIHPDDRERTDAELKRAIHERHPLTFDHRIIRADGEERVIHARGRVEFDGDGTPRRLLVTGHDVTERLRAAEARAQLAQEQARLREAEETNRGKDAFLATLSHELRTPLNAALGWTHILRDAMHAEHRHARVVQAIYRNLQLQSRIVSDILDISRITKGELPLEQERVDMRGVFEAAVDMLREAANARSVTMDVHSVGACEVRGDSRRLQQVAWNLLSNAVKFARLRGAVTVSILEGADRVECAVEDDGPGIAPSFLPHVFEQFRQADSSTTREHGGLGLGLAIAHEIVVMHGGELVAANRPQGGAMFVVRLPKSGAAAAARSTVPGKEAGVSQAPRAPGA